MSRHNDAVMVANLFGSGCLHFTVLPPDAENHSYVIGWLRRRLAIEHRRNRNECDGNGINIFTVHTGSLIPSLYFQFPVFMRSLCDKHDKNKNCGMKNVISYTSLLLF